MREKSKAGYIFLLLLASLHGYSQTIAGRLIDEDSRPIAGATVMVGKNRVATSADGHFKIVVGNLPDTLFFTSVGYQPYRVWVTDATVKDPRFEVVMLRSRSELGERVVVGYSASIEKKEFKSADVSDVFAVGRKADFSDRLAGKVPGVAAGPSSIRLRGAGSYTSVARDKTFYASGKKIAFDTIGYSKQNPTTKAVTAGEVNDFNKWKMWEDFTEKDFKHWSDHWKITPKQRFCVQLQNERYAPVVGQPVYLIQKNSRDTIWRSVTDNTGKAELWSGINDSINNPNKEYVLSTPHANDLKNPSVFEQGINRMKLEAPCNTNNTVDIAFVVDATGSMGDEIEFLKLELEDVLRNTASQFVDLELRTASVFYRDKGDQYLTRHVDFGNDLLKTLNFIKLQKADGGGDTPEAVESALHTAVDSLAWSSHARTKLLFLVLDAPPHDGTQNDLFQLIQKAAAQGVRIIPIVCSGADKGTEYLMRAMALSTNGTYVFLTDDSGIGGTHIKPTTDVFKVESLNGLLQRLIKQMVYVPECDLIVPTMQPIAQLPENVLNVKVSPNPTSGRITINSNKALKEIFIADFTGKLLMRLTKSSKAERWDADLGAYPSGTYIIKYITTENEWGAAKVVVVR